MSGSVTPTPPGGGAPSPPGGAAPPSPGGAPPGAGGGPPIGSSSATGPSQNLGATAQGNQIVSALLKLMAMALTKLPPGTPLAQSVSKAHTEIGKNLDAGAASSAGETNALKNIMMQRQRMAPQMGAMATQGGAPGGAAKPPAMAM